MRNLALISVIVIMGAAFPTVITQPTALEMPINASINASIDPPVDAAKPVAQTTTEPQAPKIPPTRAPSSRAKMLARVSRSFQGSFERKREELPLQEPAGMTVTTQQVE